MDPGSIWIPATWCQLPRPTNITQESETMERLQSPTIRSGNPSPWRRRRCGGFQIGRPQKASGVGRTAYTIIPAVARATALGAAGLERGALLYDVVSRSRWSSPPSPTDGARRPPTSDRQEPLCVCRGCIVHTHTRRLCRASRRMRRKCCHKTTKGKT